jgi:osmotically-inducible protein OsmY
MHRADGRRERHAHHAFTGRGETLFARKEGEEQTDDALQQLVSEELFWDPKVDSGAIAATAADGVVTLRGTVGSFREKRTA